MSVDIHALAGAYVLDAVTDIERAEFARHVAGCESCAQELAELRATVGRLSDATSRTAPPQLKESVMAAIAQTRQLPPGRDREARETAKRSRGWRGWVAAAAAAVVLAAGGGLAGYAIANSRVRDAQRTASAAEAQNAQINAVLTAPDARVHTDRLAAGGQVTVVVSAKLNEGLAVLSDMPPLSNDRVYQLWLLYGQQAKSVGVMNRDVLAGTQLFAGVDGATAFAISAENAGGAPAPTLPAVTSVNL
jgi:anti-sigma-K factor RskA